LAEREETERHGNGSGSHSYCGRGKSAIGEEFVVTGATARVLERSIFLEMRENGG
jgi:hypothetical protein